MVAQRTAPMVRDVFPIHSEADYDRALKLVDELWGSSSPDDLARLEVLTILVEHYEREHHSIRAPNAIEAIEFRIDQLGMSRADLGRVLGSRARATEVLSGTRPLTLAMIRKLHQVLEIPLDVLVQGQLPKVSDIASKAVPRSRSRPKGATAQRP